MGAQGRSFEESQVRKAGKPIREVTLRLSRAGLISASTLSGGMATTQTADMARRQDSPPPHNQLHYFAVNVASTSTWGENGHVRILHGAQHWPFPWRPRET